SFDVREGAEPVDHRGDGSRGATNGARPCARRTDRASFERRRGRGTVDRWGAVPAARRPTPSPGGSPWTTSAATATTGSSWSRWFPSPRTRGRDDRRRRLRCAAAGARPAAEDHRHRGALDGLALLPHRRDQDEHTAPHERRSGLDREELVDELVTWSTMKEAMSSRGMRTPAFVSPNPAFTLPVPGAFVGATKRTIVLSRLLAWIASAAATSSFLAVVGTIPVMIRGSAVMSASLSFADLTAGVDQSISLAIP